MPITQITDKKIERLPLWARGYIRQLETKVKNLQIQAKGLKGEENSGIKATLTESGQDIFLPKRCTVRFKVSDSLWVSSCLRSHGRSGNAVDIYTSDQAIILPESTNHFQIISGRRIQVVAE